MRLYQTTGNLPRENGDPDPSITSRWAGSQADAGKQRVELRAAKCTDVETHEQDVPTSKVELLSWLNEHKVVV